MAGNKPKKKTAKRRPMSKYELAMASPVWASTARRPLQDATISERVNEARLAFHRVVTGGALPTDADDLAFPANVSMQLAVLKPEYGAEFLPSVFAAQAALLRAGQREDRTGSYGFTGPEQQALKEMMDLFEQQLQVCTLLDFMTAMVQLDEKVKRGMFLTSESLHD